MSLQSPLKAPADRRSLAERFKRTRAASLALAAPLSAEDQALQSMPDASPTKWHLAHTSWFYETFILRAFAPDYAVFDETYAYLFNSYYEAEGPRHPRPERGALSRPSLADIHRYRAHVEAAVVALIAEADAGIWTKIRPLIELGINHEEQHQELILMDVKHLLSKNPLLPAYRRRTPHEARSAAPLEWRSFDGGLREIGHQGDGFAFDNEGPRHKVWIEPFRLACRLTTVGEYLAFIEEGGYRRPEFWLSDGFDAVRQNSWEAPLYWRRDGEDWRIFTLSGERPLNSVEPVSHISFYEADAFARWAGKRLATEAEWEIASANAEIDGAFADSGHAHPLPSKDPGRLSQMFGDLWEWTQSPYTPYPRFKPAKGAIGEYNGKFMTNQMVLRGGSCVTPKGHVRPTYRNFFPPAARWVFSGIRLADDV